MRNKLNLTKSQFKDLLILMNIKEINVMKEVQEANLKEDVKRKEFWKLQTIKKYEINYQTLWNELKTALATNIGMFELGYKK